jgi:hypothetical protein
MTRAAANQAGARTAELQIGTWVQSGAPSGSLLRVMHIRVGWAPVIGCWHHARNGNSLDKVAPLPQRPDAGLASQRPGMAPPWPMVGAASLIHARLPRYHPKSLQIRLHDAHCLGAVVLPAVT